MALTVGADGKVLEAQVISGHPLLVQAALDVVRKWEFAPFMLEGVPATVRTEAVLDFVLPANRPHPHVPFPEVSDFKSVKVTFSRGGCFGSCPVYELKITGDGTVTYDGSANVFLTGTHAGGISDTEFRELVEEFRQADFFSLQDDYTGGVMDAWMGNASITIGSDSKKVSFYDHTPQIMRQVEKTVTRLAHSEQWLTGNPESVPNLIAGNFDLKAAQKGALSYLVSAASYSTAAVVSDLIRAGADIHATGYQRETPLMIAATRGLAEMVEVLLKAGSDPNAADEGGRTVLMYGATSGNLAVLRQLLKSGAAVNARSNVGNTPLMEAARAGNPELVSLLLKSGAKVNVTGWQHTTALIAGSTGELEGANSVMFAPRAEIPDEVVDRAKVVRLLVRAGADVRAVNDDGENALSTVDDEAVRELIKSKINVNSRDNDGLTPLMDTVSGGVARLLVQAGAELNATDPKGRSALMLAAERNYSDILKVLLTAKAKTDLQDKEGRTALMLAADEGLEDSVQILLDYHANVNLRDKQGRTVLARFHHNHPKGHYAVIEKTLVNAGATE